MGSSGSSRWSISSSCSLPHQPQLDEVAPSLGVGVGALPPVSTVTTLNALSTAEPSAQYLIPDTADPPSSPSVWQ